MVYLDFIRPKITDKNSGIYGHVDYINSEGIGGWLIDVSSPEPRVVEVYVNDEKIGEAIANLPRPDIAFIIGREANCGFFVKWSQLNVPSRISLEDNFEVVVIDKVSGREIVGKHAKGRKPKFVGRIEEEKKEVKQETKIEDERIKKEYRIIKESGLFDEEWYLEQYPDVKKTGKDSILHYILSGWKEGRNPSKFFDTSYYLNTYLDIKKQGINPLVHFILHGWKEGRNPSATFNTKEYLLKHPELIKSNINPLKHFMLNLDKEKIVSYYFENFEKLASELRLPIITRNSDICVFTISSKNYIDKALTLCASLKNFHKQVDFFIVLCDMIDNYKDLEELRRIINNYNIWVIPIYAHTILLDIDELEEMLFKYNILEMNTAIKPFSIDFFFKLGYNKVIYFDPDILITDTLEDLFGLLDKYSICLTPHILEPLPNDGEKPSDLDIILAGVFNLGFIALRYSHNTKKFISWWQEKLRDGCYMDVTRGFHVDQKWIDLVPVLFDNVFIIKDKTYNVAYWNLHERKIYKVGNKIYVNGKPLKFFHFSGIDMENISRHQTRYDISRFPHLKELFELYYRELENNSNYFISKDYYFGKLPCTDIRIHDTVRRVYGKEIAEKVENPWNPVNVNNIIDKLNEEIVPGVSKIWYSIYVNREDLKKAFPNIENYDKSRKEFINWVFHSIKREYNMHDIFIDYKQELDEFIKCGFGVNLFGYFNLTIGMTAGAKRYLNILKLLGIPFSLVNIEAVSHAQNIARDYSGIKKWIVKVPIYKLNIMVINADMFKQVYEMFSLEKYRNNQYIIAKWAWELQDYFPFKDSFNYVDEVWFPTEFVVNTIKKHSTKPVKKIPLVHIPDWKKILPTNEVRKKIGLDINDFAFLFAFDFYSSFERKNPDGVIKAFIQAFPRTIKDVKLIIKSQHGYRFPDKLSYLKELSRNDERIIIIDQPMTQDEYASLLNSCDVFVSLHRSEGIGYNLIEAMLLAKPVIATAYGGNLEFCNSANSLLVDYVPTEIKEDFGPYKKGLMWAEPNIDKASEYMLNLYLDRKFTRELGLIGREYILSMHRRNIIECIDIFKEVFIKIVG